MGILEAKAIGLHEKLLRFRNGRTVSAPVLQIQTTLHPSYKIEANHSKLPVQSIPLIYGIIPKGSYLNFIYASLVNFRKGQYTVNVGISSLDKLTGKSQKLVFQYYSAWMIYFAL